MNAPQSLIAPFVGAKLKPSKGFTTKPDGTLAGMAREAISITAWPVGYVDADVRRVTDDGVEVFHSRDCTLIPWDEIDRVEVHAWADDGRSKRLVAEWVRGEQAELAA